MQDSLLRPDPAPREAPSWTPDDTGVLVLATLGIGLALAIWLPGTEAARRLWPAGHDWLSASAHRAGALACFSLLFGASAGLLTCRLRDAPREGDARHEKATLRGWRTLALFFGGLALVFWGLPMALGAGDGNLFDLSARLGSMPVRDAGLSLGGPCLGAGALATLRRDRAKRAPAGASSAAAQWHGPKGA